MACTHADEREPSLAGWFKPLRRLLSRVDVKTLFHPLDRGEGANEPPAHKVLVSQLLHAFQSPSSTQQLASIFTDDSWLQVSSSDPMLSWVRALKQEGVEPPMDTVVLWKPAQGLNGDGAYAGLSGLLPAGQSQAQAIMHFVGPVAVYGEGPRS